MTTKKKTGRPAVELTGQRFGRLQVIEATAERSRNRGILWRCKCACGGTALARGDRLRAGLTSSCGCVARARDDEFWWMARRMAS